MKTTLPPEAIAALETAAETLKHEATSQSPSSSTQTPNIPVPASVKPSVLQRLVSGILSPFKALAHLAAMSALTTALVICLMSIMALGGYITGSETQRIAAVFEKDALVASFVRELPMSVKFKQGAVENYGFFRNWLWRQDSSKEFTMAAVISTDKNANSTMKDTKIIQTSSSGDVYQLKPGTSDVWQLLPATAVVKPQTDVK